MWQNENRFSQTPCGFGKVQEPLNERNKEKMKEFKSPVYNVVAVPIEEIQANAYNPNSVAPPEMKLLYKSILEDGYTMPIVCYKLDNGKYEIVDGFHRYTIMKTHKDIYEREGGKIPVVVIDKDISNRMASTIRHNRARGSHSIELMSNIVAELVEAGMSDAWILKNIGMDADELLRLKQLTGLAALFKDKEFSTAWEAGCD
jgi:ParB-like chromosome segregation protein Spo0J